MTRTDDSLDGVTANLTGRRVIVTGAATGIGAAAVEVFARAGASVAAVYNRSPPPEERADSASWRQCDMRERGAVDATFDAIDADLGGIDVLVHAAGLWLPTSDTCDEEELDFLIATNFKATVFANQAAHRHMRENGGRIINFGSIEGVRGSANVVYAATKSAVHGWTRAVAQAWGKHGITVNAIAPAMETPGAERFRDHVGPEVSAALDGHLRATMPLRGALGDPVADLGPVLVFLAGDGARFITGQVLAVDGGLMMLGS